ncbi:hypothetical protein RA086_12930 [Lactiplantibacillus sp. WILCCON 0030]|uniref:Uncharacterized protein n=1 Tax=Lactiplantibacillus brownii TaxID=3069269 RepID=A0ABU1AC21_9LACO|nr:hypothetical protein [Lactiplantibacillus brownii]MDQ7938511.1 hypothetical protein [Lactiplantibacillus brownii]
MDVIELPKWVLDWSEGSLIFIVVLTLVSVILLSVPLRETIPVDFFYMLITFYFAWRRSKRTKNQ